MNNINDMNLCGLGIIQFSIENTLKYSLKYSLIYIIYNYLNLCYYVLYSYYWDTIVVTVINILDFIDSLGTRNNF